jgi:hypothetical protein
VSDEGRDAGLTDAVTNGEIDCLVHHGSQ